MEAQLGSRPGPVSLRVPPPPIREIVAVPPSGLFELASNSSIACSAIIRSDTAQLNLAGVGVFWWIVLQVGA